MLLFNGNITLSLSKMRPRNKKQTKLTSTERSRKRRAKVKADEEKHKKEKDRLRKKLKRQMLKERANGNASLLAEMRGEKKKKWQSTGQRKEQKNKRLHVQGTKSKLHHHLLLHKRGRKQWYA